MSDEGIRLPEYIKAGSSIAISKATIWIGHNNLYFNSTISIKM